MTTLRVLVLGDGRSFHLHRFLAELRHQGVVADLASCEFEGTDALPLGRAWRNPRWRYGAAGHELRGIIRNGNYHLVNPHFVSGYGFLAARSLAMQIPIVTHAWGSDILLVPHKSMLHRWKTVRALRRSQLVLTDSGYLEQAVRSLYPGVVTDVIPWGIEEQCIPNLSPRNMHPPLRLISPRRLEPVYGIIELIDELCPLLADRSVTLTIPDFGSQREQIEAKLQQDQIPGVSMYAMKSRPELLQFLSAHDCYCSNARSDSSPASLLEAMALGVYPIVRDHPGLCTWLEPNNGILVGRRFQTFVEALRSLLAGDIDIAGALGRNQTRIRQQAVFEANIAATVRHFRSVAGLS